MKRGNQVFWIFGILQALTLASIIWFLLEVSNIGTDTRLILSTLFPLFLLIVEYLIYKK